MQEKHLYEYAVIRVVPAVERDEFVNAGIILFCKKQKFIRVLYSVERLRRFPFTADFDVEEAEQNLESLVQIANGSKQGGRIAQLDVPSRFRWLTAVRSSSIQTSRPHPGFCDDLEKTTQRLFHELVL